MASMTEPITLQDIMPNYGTDLLQTSSLEATILSGENLGFGKIVGAIKFAVGTPVYTRIAASIGTVGTITMGVKAKYGNYTMTCTGAGAGGAWTVEDPDGISLPGATEAVAYTNDQINFTITNAGGGGADDFDVGDVIVVPIDHGSYKCVEWDPDGVDGRQYFRGILTENCDASAADKTARIIYKDADLYDYNSTDGTGIIYLAGTTDAQKRVLWEQMLEQHVRIVPRFTA